MRNSTLRDATAHSQNVEAFALLRKPKENH